MEGRTIVDTIADNAAMGAMVIGGRPVKPDAVDLRWVSAILYKNQTVEETGVAAGVLDHPANGVHWLANKIAAHGDALKAGDIILAGSFTRPLWAYQGRHRPRRLRTPRECDMPLRIDDTFRDALPHQQRDARPPAGRDVGVLRQPADRRALRRIRPGLAAGGRRAQPQRARIHPRPAPGHPRLPGPDAGPAAGQRHRGDQAVPGPRRAEPADPHGQLGRRGRSRGGRHPLPAARRPRRRLGPGPGRPLEPGPGLPRPGQRTPSASPSRSNPPPQSKQSRTSSQVDGVDAIFIGPSDLAASMGLLGQQEHPEVRAAVEHCLAAAKAAGKPAGVNAFNPDTAQHYLDNGADFILVGADVALLARGSEALAAKFIQTARRRNPRPATDQLPASAAGQSARRRSADARVAYELFTITFLLMTRQHRPRRGLPAGQ